MHTRMDDGVFGDIARRAHVGWPLPGNPFAMFEFEACEEGEDFYAG